MEGHLKMAEFEITFGIFSPLRNSKPGRSPTRIRPQQKKEKKICVFFHRLSRPSEVMCFLTLPLFERAFEPSLIFERAFEPLPPFERAFEPSLPSF